MGYDFVVFGATGIQGRIATRDLLESGYSVMLCGRDKPRVEHLLKHYRKTDFKYINGEKINTMVDAAKSSRASVIVNCMEGDWNLNALHAAIKANASIIDLGSEIPMTKEQFALHDKLKQKNLLSITGIGSVPGIGNVMLKHAAEKLDTLDDIEVGFAWDSNIKKFVVPFSMPSIAEEFSDPAPVVQNKHFIKKTPMDSIIEDYHRGIGKQKEFYVRHPEQYTFFNSFKNKGVRNIKFYAGFPEHSFRAIHTLMEMGFGSKEKMDFFGTKIAPVDFMAQVLKNVQMPKGYKEKENLWLRIKGKKAGKPKHYLMECIVPTIHGWEEAGCNIDTGMPASILAQMIKCGLIAEKGSFAPEQVIPQQPFFRELKKRKMLVYENGKQIN